MSKLSQGQFSDFTADADEVFAAAPSDIDQSDQLRIAEDNLLRSLCAPAIGTSGRVSILNGRISVESIEIGAPQPGSSYCPLGLASIGSVMPERVQEAIRTLIYSNSTCTLTGSRAVEIQL